MAELEDKRREVFAAAVARGLSKVAAHREAGFAGDTGNAARMAREPAVMARIEELRAEQPPIIDVAAPEPSSAGLGASGGKPDRIREFEQIRDAALAKGHTSAAATAQRDLTKAERVAVSETKLWSGDLQKLAREVLGHLRAMKAERASPEQIVRAKLGIPEETWLGWGLPLGNVTPIKRA